MWYVGPLAIVPSLYGLVVCMFLFTTLAFVATLVRFYTRAFLIHRQGWDDWFMILTMVFSLFFFVSVCFQIKYGLGKEENPATIVEFLAAIYSTVAIYNFTQMLYKLSVACQAHRIFKTDPTRTMINVLMVWLVICGIMTVCGALFYCVPVEKCWNIDLPGRCGDRSTMVYCWAAFNLLNDIIILVLPIPYLVRLQLNHKSRLVLLSLFACGFFTTLISVIRVKALYDSMSRAITDQPITGVNIALWSCIEINLAIITGSVPSLRPFVGRFITGEPYNSSQHDYGHQIMTGPAALVAQGGGGGSGGGGAMTNRKSQLLLHDLTDDPDYAALAYPYPCHARLKIQVQQSIEMNSLPMDDADSSRSLMGRVRSGPTTMSGSPDGGGGGAGGDVGFCSSGVAQSVTRIQGGPRRGSDTYSPV